MDATLSGLPLERILLVAEHAARDQFLVWASWAATLCLVCEGSRSVVTPILYAIIIVTADSFNYLTAYSCLPDTSLRHTTSAIFMALDHWTSEEALQVLPLTRALSNVSAFTGSTCLLVAMIQSGQVLNLPFASLTDVTFVSQYFEIAAAHPVVLSLSRLHIFHRISDGEPGLHPDLSSSRVEYLIIDLFSEAGSLGDEIIDMAPITPLVTSSPRLRRVLFRPRWTRELDSQRMALDILEWAQGRRDQRIYIDDMFVTIGDDEWSWEDLDKQDAPDGDSLWFRGRQAWYPPARSPKCQ